MKINIIVQKRRIKKPEKKILDEGNDTIRELEENMDQFDIRLK